MERRWIAQGLRRINAARTAWRGRLGGKVQAPVGRLAERAGLSQPAMSQHLAKLREDGLVATRRAGTTIHYRIADPRVARIMATLHDIFCPPEN